MADLIVISFDTKTDAEAAYNKVLELQDDLIVQLAGLALVTVDDEGKTHVTHPGPVGKVGIGAAGGAVFGALLGILFFMPLVGLVIGGAFGALFAALDKAGINSEFRERVQDTVSAGKSAIVLYATKLTQDKFTEALAPYNGTVVQTSLSKEQEAQLADNI
ncbi:DUF1269 domain-containing protein [Mycetocola zhujimingii]|uniref:DUF1269 domain-containing protein n=1 Tax=Mycetocola zhujimingii TaxID=2079792 RepID=A0A2U1TCL1_9MICO|nr:DUF1269 domain-containing protein [Mycetocola zhujimingii]AWB86190.1 hypothetical protein C3E77_05910 [Mycetocola zhujimingii]PWC06628.1 DUF1269 domain-containing protein [Mycetocola zhujimingii]